MVHPLREEPSIVLKENGYHYVDYLHLQHQQYASNWALKQTVRIIKVFLKHYFVFVLDAIVYNDERFGISDVRSGLNYLNCPSDASSLSQCSEVRKGSSNGCYVYISKCGTEYGLKCFSKFHSI